MPQYMLEPSSTLPMPFLQQTYPSTPNSATSYNNRDEVDNSSILFSSMMTSVGNIGREEKNSSNVSSSYTSDSLNDYTYRTPSVSSMASSTLFNSGGAATSVAYNEQTRIGYMRSLQIFFYQSCNLLLNRANLQREKIRNICCFTLDIYKLFIQKIKMDNYTW
jgi:hypothetical protein